MDKINECEEDVCFIGTTNLPWELDLAFLRRFERKILVPLMNLEDRILMIKHSF